jgi:RHS repeat-associated protein
LQNFGYSYDIFANLAARTDNLRNLEETFTYDHLNRLTDIWLNGNLTGHMAYDALGRMTDKQSDGQQVFASAQHDYIGPDGQLRPHAVSSATMQDFSPATDCQEITYTMFDKVHHLTIGDFMPTAVGFEYGYDHQRIRMTTTYAAGMTIEKRYCGNCEFVDYGSGDESYTFISGPLGVFAVVEKKVSGVESVHYVLKDHLGSWTTITDANGNIIREQSFDAWGIMRDPYTWTGNTVLLPMFDRGYTGHEHLNAFGLINMNGRMYDPIMSSFLSVDNYVQAPDFSQSFNRYAYCLNNPLRYVDPEGEEFITAAIIIGGVIIGAYTGGALANGGNYNITQWNWDMGTAIGVIGGGIAGGLSAGAGFAVAGAGFAFCNTTAIAASSLVYSTGMYATGQLAGFDYDISMSIGVASYNFTKGEFGYLFKEGNSVWDNIGYGLGALTNASDIYRFATWDVLTKQQRYDKLERWAAKKYGEQNMEYVPQFYDAEHRPIDIEGTYNWETDKIRISDLALTNDFGYAKSTYLHELNHRLDMTPKRPQLIINKFLRSFEWDYYENACAWHDQFYYASDARSYAFELNNAARNGLSLREYCSILENYRHYSQLSGVSPQISRYSLWTLFKSTFWP